jgi:hypothetical protein
VGRALPAGAAAGTGAAATSAEAVAIGTSGAPTEEELAVHTALHTTPSPSRTGAAEGELAEEEPGTSEPSAPPAAAAGEGEQGDNALEPFPAVLAVQATDAVKTGMEKKGRSSTPTPAAGALNANLAAAAEVRSCSVSGSSAPQADLDAVAAILAAAAPSAVAAGGVSAPQDILRCRVASSSSTQSGGWGGTAGPGEAAK